MSQFNKIYLDPNIYYVKNFLSQSEVDKILSSTFEWNLINENGNGSDYFNENDVEFFEDGVSRRLVGVIKSEEEFWWNVVVKRLRDLLDNDNEKYNAVPYITKYLPEGEWGLYYHYENHPDCGPIGMYTTLGFTLALNEGWSGGEVEFKNKPIKVNVKPGDILVFPSSEEYTHAVHAVRGKERIVHSAFVYSNDFYKSDICPNRFSKDYDQSAY